jgi:DNA-binding PadR family transcriptional regulator
MTPALRDVLLSLLAADGEVWGLYLSAQTGRPTGTVYPILERLERERFLRSRWEDDEGRAGPRRRLYSLTTSGREWVASRLGASGIVDDGGA